MNQDVKALPVVAWIWRWANGEEEVVFVDATNIEFNPQFEDVPTQIASLVRQSDAESALAELRERAEAAEEALRFVERWAVHHGQKPSITSAEALSLIQHYPPIKAITQSYVDGKVPETPDPFARVDAAEARLEKARGLLRDCETTAIKRGDKYLCDAIDNDGEPYQSEALAAFLGEGNG